MIAIDGPVASGKSAVGRRAARRLGYRFLDTGWMYRAVTWAAIHRQVNILNEDALTHLTHHIQMELVPGKDNGDRLVLDGIDMTDHLRDHDVQCHVSPVSAVRGVREALVAQQRSIASKGSIVMVGRDIGTVVLPDAEVKVFLTASLDIRARRRYEEVRAGGVTYEEVVADLLRRDKIDSERAESPLRQAGNAVLIETDRLTVDEIVDRIMGLARVKTANEIP